MNTVIRDATGLSPALSSAIERAMNVIAPSWPLDRQIAVNPYWGFIDHPFEQAATKLRRLIGARFTHLPAEYLRAWEDGEIGPAALTRAIAESRSTATPEDAVAALRASRTTCTGLSLLSDIIDQSLNTGARPRWNDTITQQVSQYCASYFDQHQADWHRGRTAGLFAGWRSGLARDHALEPLMDAPEIRARVQNLPNSVDAAIAWSLERLGVTPEEAEELLQVCLLRINGWASWCAYLGWEARLAGSTDPHLRELLAIRISWEALLHDGRRHQESVGSQWRRQWARGRRSLEAPCDPIELVWQRAQEITYQQHLIRLLASHSAAETAARDATPAAAQLVFCIDVRSERLRRALERTDPSIETRGFAGFFGLPVQYRPIGTSVSRPQLPGLLLPTIEVTDSTGSPPADSAIAAKRAQRLAVRDALQPFQRLPSGAFSLVETVGLGYAAALLRRHYARGTQVTESVGLAVNEARRLRPQIPVSAADNAVAKADLVASILRAMSLTSEFARLLILVGHGSESANNPQAKALDCGACGGQSGEINARVIAGLLNDPEVRIGLRKHGIDIPENTVAVGALHNTTTDEVQLLDSELVPRSHALDIARLQSRLVEAGDEARSERAAGLGLSNLAQKPAALLKQLRRRARDWAETRPEWGLADNAAFIVAPRARTRGLDLAARIFLHDYVWTDDRDGKVLELIMTAPMIVTHWINLQYYASTVDPDHFGSGNKVLHNVACGRIGVFEGNTGDLRVGLSRQSLHDGERWRHTPIRLSVIIDAPRDRIDLIIARHPTVRQLVENRWLYVLRFAGDGLEQRNERSWQPIDHQAAVA